MLHQAVIDLKYRGVVDNGYMLGRLLGQNMLAVAQQARFDAIVPVPLHRRKTVARGYNQARLIAQGLSETLALPVLPLLRRKRFTTTQTRMPDLAHRLNNMHDVFSLSHPEKAVGKHLLLLDDVITTGATIGGAAYALRDIAGLKLSVASIAVTMRLFGGNMLNLLGGAYSESPDMLPLPPSAPVVLPSQAL